jgi:magnesium-protoporphyrin IX monomethyl ester (oxidative) cyclase
MVRVLLINPYMEIDAKDYTYATAHPILGLAYIAAFLEKQGYQPRILDCLASRPDKIQVVGSRVRIGLDDEDIKNYVREFDPDVVGITCSYTAHAAEAHNVARLVEEVDSNVCTVFGGAHASGDPEEVMKDGNIDLVVRGEGEITFWEIVRRLETGKDLYETPGTVVRIKDKVKYNKDRPFIEDLDSLPFPARHIMPMDIYLKDQEQKFPYNMRTPFTTMISSRGCPYNCVYCDIKAIWGRLWRPRSAQNVVDEIEYLVDSYGVREIHFLDDNISVDKKRLEEICKEIINRNLDIKWTAPNGIAIWCLNEKLLRLMKRSGCYRLTFGLESGDEETLEFIGNPGKIQAYRTANNLIKFADKIGLWTIGTFIIGFPFEKKNQIENTISYAIKSDLDLAIFYCSTPFPGTRMYEIYTGMNLINGSDISLVLGGADSVYFKREGLSKMRAEANVRFLKSRLRKPWKVISKVRSFEDLRYVLKLAKQALKVLRNYPQLSTTAFLRPSSKNVPG